MKKSMSNHINYTNNRIILCSLILRYELELPMVDCCFKFFSPFVIALNIHLLFHITSDYLPPERKSVFFPRVGGD